MVSSDEIKKKLEEKRRGEDLPDKKAKICPKCGFKNPFSLSTCWRCNAALKKRKTLDTVYRAKEWWNKQGRGVKLL